MKNQKEYKWKIILDNFLIFNLYILILGAIVLLISFLLSLNGNPILFNLFQKLWYPLFIPSLSLFFTAILIEAIISKVITNKNK